MINNFLFYLSYIYSISLLFIFIINSNVFIIILEICIIIVQVDNFSLLYDYNKLKKYYEKLINNEYRINKLTNICNNLLKKYISLEEDYFNLLTYYDNKNINDIIILNNEINKYKTLYNIYEFKLNNEKKFKSSKSLNDLYNISPPLIFKRSETIINDLYKECE